ncbi:MAG: polymer-forming cytoskeletal protein [Dechloromonas sp.]|nr:MAG: polymer-forming cytoskeletal protein [Dechloromonas sp.]
MFNKPSFNNRNDVVTRKDVRTPNGTSTQQPVADFTTRGALQAAAAETTPHAAEPASSATATPTPTQPAAETGGNIAEARLIVGPDVKLKGAEILDCDTLVVEGRVEATMDSRVIRIAEQGSFTGKVSIDIAEIHGSFEGDLTARQQLIVHATGRVSGKIRYGKLVIDEGGELCGDINTLNENQCRKSASRACPP